MRGRRGGAASSAGSTSSAGLSRFTTWAYKFVIFEVSSKVARHAWQRHPPSAEEPTWEQLPDSSDATPGEQVERREQLAELRRGRSSTT